MREIFFKPAYPRHICFLAAFLFFFFLFPVFCKCAYGRLRLPYQEYGGYGVEVPDARPLPGAVLSLHPPLPLGGLCFSGWGKGNRRPSLQEYQT